MQGCRKIKITKVNDEIVEMKCTSFDLTDKEVIIYDVPSLVKGKYVDCKIPSSIIKMIVYFL